MPQLLFFCCFYLKLTLEVGSALVGILITLWKCCLQMKNMDKLTFVHKNWPFDSWIGCLKHIDVASACEVEYDLMVKLEAEFED